MGTFEYAPLYACICIVPTHYHHIMDQPPDCILCIRQYLVIAFSSHSSTVNESYLACIVKTCPALWVVFSGLACDLLIVHAEFWMVSSWFEELSVRRNDEVMNDKENDSCFHFSTVVTTFCNGLLTSLELYRHFSKIQWIVGNGYCQSRIFMAPYLI